MILIDITSGWQKEATCHVLSITYLKGTGRDRPTKNVRLKISHRPIYGRLV